MLFFKGIVEQEAVRDHVLYYTISISNASNFFLNDSNSKTHFSKFWAYAFLGGQAQNTHDHNLELCVKTHVILIQMFMSSAESTRFCSSKAGATWATSGSALQGSLFFHWEEGCPNALHTSKYRFGHFPSVIFVHLSLSFLIFYHESRHRNVLC